MKHPDLVYTSPERFTFKQKLALWLVAPAIAHTVKCIERTTRIEVRHGEHWERLAASGKPVILAIWHEVIALGVWHKRNSGFHALTSYSFDGELAARVIKRYGIPSLRGSSSRGGGTALVQLQKALEAGITVGWTLDGPRGPRRVAKPGVGVLAARAQVPILPYALIADPTWRMKSWDRLMIPKPFARIVAAYGPLVPPPADRSPEAVETTRLRIEQALNALHADLDREFGVASAI